MQQPEFQSFAAALVDGELPPPPGLRAARGVSVSERLAVYRNNVHASLADTLGERFPIVHALVGEEFFRAMALSHVRQCKPGSCQLQEYGRDLPGFIADFEPARDLPYLADVARLEDAWCDCWGAADATAIPVASLADLVPAQLFRASVTLHPAVRLVRSRWPVGSIWQAHQNEAPDLSGIDPLPENVLLTRPEASIELRQLPDGSATFLAALMTRLSIADAAQAAFDTSPDLDIGTALGELIRSGAITEIKLT